MVLSLQDTMVFDELEMLYEEYDDSFTEITSAFEDVLSAWSTVKIALVAFVMILFLVSMEIFGIRAIP